MTLFGTHICRIYLAFWRCRIFGDVHFNWSLDQKIDDEYFGMDAETGFLHTHKVHEELYFFLGGKGEFHNIEAILLRKKIRFLSRSGTYC